MNSSMRAFLKFGWTITALVPLLILGVAKAPLFQDLSFKKRASILSYEAHPLAANERMCLSKESSLP